jgi:hypothetical protein
VLRNRTEALQLNVRGRARNEDDTVDGRSATSGRKEANIRRAIRFWDDDSRCTVDYLSPFDMNFWQGDDGYKGQTEDLTVRENPMLKGSSFVLPFLASFFLASFFPGKPADATCNRQNPSFSE